MSSPCSLAGGGTEYGCMHTQLASITRDLCKCSTIPTHAITHTAAATRAVLSTPPTPAAAAPLSPQCSALEEQVEKHHRRHEALSAQLQELHAKLSTLQQQQHQPATTWQAASFLLFFLLFINFWGMVANFQTGWCWPWMAAKPAGSLWLKQLLGWAVPFTNTLVIVIFCMRAVKAAWICLRL